MTEQTEHSEVLSVAEVNALTGDDIESWLSNPFMSPDMLAEKVCWWITTALAADRAAAEARGAERALREAADEVADVRENGLPIERTDIPVFSHPTAEHFEDWLRARAAARGVEGGAR